MFFCKIPKRPWPPPPPSLFGNYIALFFAKVRKYALTCVNLQWNFLDWRWPPPLPPFLDIFSKIYDQNIPFWNQKICNVIFWIGNDPPPLRTFFKKTSIFVALVVPNHMLWIILSKKQDLSFSRINPKHFKRVIIVDSHVPKNQTGNIQIHMDLLLLERFSSRSLQ